jgi:hypothetical protein
VKPDAPEKEVEKPKAPEKEVEKPKAPEKEEEKPKAPEKEEAKPEAPEKKESRPKAPEKEDSKGEPIEDTKPADAPKKTGREGGSLMALLAKQEKKEERQVAGKWRSQGAARSRNMEKR